MTSQSASSHDASADSASARKNRSAPGATWPIVHNFSVFSLPNDFLSVEADTETFSCARLMRFTLACPLVITAALLGPSSVCTVFRCISHYFQCPGIIATCYYPQPLTWPPPGRPERTRGAAPFLPELTTPSLKVNNEKRQSIFFLLPPEKKRKKICFRNPRILSSPAGATPITNAIEGQLIASASRRRKHPNLSRLSVVL